jgi:hypothetical protein
MTVNSVNIAFYALKPLSLSLCLSILSLTPLLSHSPLLSVLLLSLLLQLQLQLQQR